MSNNSEMEKAIKQYQKKLKNLTGDISKVNEKILTKSVNVGLGLAKKETPVGSYSSTVNFITKEGKQVNFNISPKRGGFMRKSWRVSKTTKNKNYAEKLLINSADYASFVNDGHRIVNRNGEILGWVNGKFILEAAENKVFKVMKLEFKKEIERIQRKHGGKS